MSSVSFEQLISNLEALKNDIQAAIYRMNGTKQSIKENVNGIASSVKGSQNGPQALSLMQAAESELEKACQLAQDAISMCDQDIANIQTH